MAKKVSRVAALTAARDGGEAQRAGKTVTDCPHSPTGDAGDRLAAHYWLKGYGSSTLSD